MQLLCRSIKNGHEATQLCPLPSFQLTQELFLSPASPTGKYPCWPFLHQSMLTHKPTIHQLPSSPTCSHMLTKRDSTNARGGVSCRCSRYTSEWVAPNWSWPALQVPVPQAPFPLYCFQKQPGVSERADDRDQGSQSLGFLGSLKTYCR